MVTWLESPYDFLAIDELGQYVTIKTGESDEEGNYDQAVLEFLIDIYSFKVQIYATIESSFFESSGDSDGESEGTTPIAPSIQPYEYQVQTTPVKPNIVSLDSSGLLTIRFNATMNTSQFEGDMRTLSASPQRLTENQFNDE